MYNPFIPFTEVRGPLKLLVYGDPGTMKTRRALAMPAPIYIIDMEGGSSDYGDLVKGRKAFRLDTKSHAEVVKALQLLTSGEVEVGTLIIDPITIIWDSIKNGHVTRQMKKRRGMAAEEVNFDVGTWGTLKRVYGDIISTILNAPFHVVMIARGKEKIDERGNVIGYAAQAEKSTAFLANVVIATRANGDVIVKDRTGTFKTDQELTKRVAFTAFLENTGDHTTNIQTDSEAASETARVEDGLVSKREFNSFIKMLSDVGLTIEQLDRWVKSQGWPQTRRLSYPDLMIQLKQIAGHRKDIDEFLGAKS